ncbi:zinc finger CCCH domain-containing protein 13 [Rosa chinensis]|uniref:zinc finger CCCH domain-containing protein 13 n=1 Tax=Rosa chinensis TaxID=74649 RepID=UPI001AD92D47|nr:zinc finger CCCH domain-containing protein 13 [Rosa chinensis]
MASRFVLVFTLSALLLLSSRPALSKDAVVDDDDEDLSFLKEPTEQQGHSHDAALHYPDSDEFDGESYDDADDFSDFDEGDQEAYKEPEDFVILKGANFSKTIKKNRHYDPCDSDSESSGTDLDHHRRNRRRRQQQPLDLEKGDRDGDGVGGDSSDPDPRYTLSDRRHQDRRASGPGFLADGLGFWRRLVHKAPGGCINARDATRVGGVIADNNECIERERRKGQTERESDSQFYDFKISDVRNENVREQRAARKTTQRREGRTETESDRQSQDEEISDVIHEREQRAARKTIQRRERRTEGVSVRAQHLEDGMAQIRKEQNERSKQRATRRERDARTRIENQLAYESRPKWRDTQRDSEKKELGLVHQQEMNAKRREDLLKERRALTRADIRMELQRERLKDQIIKWHKDLDDLMDERQQLRKRNASLKKLWWISIVVDGVILTCLDLYIEDAGGIRYWTSFVVYMILFSLWWGIISKRQQKLDGPPEAIECGAGLMKGLCVIALKMVLINRFKKESLLYYVVKCFFYVGARGLI